jgi:hypothetical protein
VTDLEATSQASSTPPDLVHLLSSDSDFEPDDDDMEIASPPNSTLLGLSSPTGAPSTTSLYQLASPPDPDCKEEAIGMWDDVRMEYSSQYSIKVPALDSGPALYRFANKHPAHMVDLCRFCPNPFLILDYFTDDALKEWMLPERMERCVQRLETVIQMVQDGPTRTTLSEWITNIKALSTDAKTQRAVYRDADMWKGVMKAHPASFRGPTAIPFLSRNFSKEYACVLVLDLVFPALAKDVMRITWGAPGNTWSTDISLEEAHQRCPSFAQVLTTAMTQESWLPVITYMNTTTALAEPEDECGHLASTN